MMYAVDEEVEERVDPHFKLPSLSVDVSKTMFFPHLPTHFLTHHTPPTTKACMLREPHLTCMWSVPALHGGTIHPKRGAARTPRDGDFLKSHSSPVGAVGAAMATEATAPIAAARSMCDVAMLSSPPQLKRAVGVKHAKFANSIGIFIHILLKINSLKGGSLSEIIFLPENC